MTRTPTDGRPETSRRTVLGRLGAGTGGTAAADESTTHYHNPIGPEGWPVVACDGTPNTRSPTPWSDEFVCAGDLDGDGRYEDVNGNGRADFDDAAELFDRMEAVDDGSKYDFNGNGRLDFADVVALFDSLR